MGVTAEMRGITMIKITLLHISIKNELWKKYNKQKGQNKTVCNTKSSNLMFVMELMASCVFYYAVWLLSSIFSDTDENTDG